MPARGRYCPQESFFTVKLAISSSLDGAVIRNKAHGSQRAMCGVTQSFLVTSEPVMRCCVLSLGGSPWLFTRGFSWGLPFTFSLCPVGTLPRRRSVPEPSFPEGKAAEVLTPRVLYCHYGLNPVFSLSHTHKVRYDLSHMRKESTGYLEFAFLLCAEWEP